MGRVSKVFEYKYAVPTGLDVLMFYRYKHLVPDGTLPITDKYPAQTATKTLEKIIVFYVKNYKLEYKNIISSPEYIHER